MTKTIKNFENYTITENGVVTNMKTGRVLKQSIANGYYQICLSRNNIKKHYFIHQLVARTFISDYNTDTQVVDHKDGDRLNNNLDNLHIVTQRLNMHNKINQSKYGLGVIRRDNKNDIKYKATININKKNIYLGSFDTADKAYSKYKYVADQISKLDLENRNYKVTKIKKGDEYHLIFLLN